MVKLNNVDMENLAVLGSKGAFNFSATKIDNLGSTEYTLVTIAWDVSGSVETFEKELLESLKSVIGACKKSPRAENLLLRIVEFNHNINEVHGFKLLNTIDTNDYNIPKPNGRTALFDAVYSSVGATMTYAKKLIEQDFCVNGICFIITDGEDNESKTTKNMIADCLKNAKTGENIESLITVLIGINAGNCSGYLNSFKDESGLTQYVDVGDATPQKLAKLATFVSKSISSQSQSLGSGGPSQPLKF